MNINLSEGQRMITEIIAWITSLGAGGIFVACLLLNKLTKPILRIVAILMCLAVAFWALTNSGVQISFS